MSASGYAVIFALIPFAFATVATWAYRAGGGRWLWGAWAAAAATLGWLGYIEWRRVAAAEMPLVAYLVLATVPTLAGAWAVRWAGGRAMPGIAQILLAGSACWAAIFPTLFVGGYLLPRLLPYPFGFR